MTNLQRGGSDENTVYCLGEISSLAEALEDPVVAELVIWLEGWTNRGLVVLGDRDKPRYLPRQPGETEPRCPYCACLTLRFWASRGEVRCVNPGCRDESGQRPCAVMEYSIIAIDWVLAWKDGMVGLQPVPKREVA